MGTIESPESGSEPETASAPDAAADPIADTSDLDGIAVAVVGAGLIGAAWAALFHHHGATVTLHDPSREAIDTAESRIGTMLGQLRELAGSRHRSGRIRMVGELAAAVDNADLVQENAPEDLALKHRLYAEIEKAAPHGAIVASSTSSFTWSELSPGLDRPGRFVTAHPFNPPHLVPLVEIYGIDDEVVTRAEELYRAAGRTPVRLRRDATGHLANRLASALWREAVHIVAEGIADVDAVDSALVHGPGLRWSVVGAHMAYHLGGGADGMAGYLEHLGEAQERRWSDLGSPSLTPEVRAALVAGVTEQADGRSIGELAARRDAALIAMLRARSGIAGS
ncbi:MAG: 3-hydroxyacyl-CoA dehydrogenase NAD-binding domain-containing protein [Acidimicrobiales bacterium]